MCKYCDGTEYENEPLITRNDGTEVVIDCERGSWLKLVQDDGNYYAASVAIDYCPKCGREL